MQSSLARIVMAACIAVFSLATSAGWVLYRATLEREQQTSQRPPAYAGSLLASQISAITRDWSRATQAIARSQFAQRLLQTNNETERREQLALLSGLYPSLGSVQLISSEQASGQTPIPELLGAQQKHLIEKARAAKVGTTTVHVEPLVLTLSEPVRSPEGAIIGFVLIERDLAEVRELFTQSPLIDGYAELQQINTASDTLLKRGNEQLKASGTPALFPLSGTPWRLALWARSPAGMWERDLNRSYQIVGSLLALLLVLVFAVAYTVGNNSLQADLDALTKLFSDITHGRVRKHYDIELKEVRNSYHIMYQLAKMMVGKHLRAISSAGTDHLSQVNNRRSFEAKQHEVFGRVKEGWAHSLLILDIDNFKHVNDTYGHDAGDQLIVQFGKALKDHLRASDFVSRLGGDEFCVIFPNTPLKKATELAERLRENLPHKMELIPGVIHTASWSGGLSEYSRLDQSENAALSRADQALLDAKRAGRSRTEIKAAA
jgi:diguanylate cyclase (GGDEF)-like protein